MDLMYIFHGKRGMIFKCEAWGGQKVFTLNCKLSFVSHIQLVKKIYEMFFFFFFFFQVRSTLFFPLLATLHPFFPHFFFPKKKKKEAAAKLKIGFGT